MDDLNSNGVGTLPDSSASAGTPPPTEDAGILESPVEIVEEGSLEEISDVVEETPDGEESTETSEEDISSEMESAIKPDQSDTPLVKKLRDLLKVKYEDFSSKVQSTSPEPQLSDHQKQVLELAETLFEFDVDSAAPSTRKFAENLAKRDISVAEMALSDLSSIPVDSSGYTLGHKFLEKIGLDPYKLEEFRKISRGEADVSQYGMVVVHEKVPKELSEAYKSLSPVIRSDVDIYLDSDDQGQISAALQTLQNQQIALNSVKQRQVLEQEQQTKFASEIGQALEQDLDTTYSGILNSLKETPAYKSVKLSSEASIDTMIKDSVIAQINALGDPRSILAKQAVQIFEQQGVKVNLEQIAKLMDTVESATKIAITAEKMGKAQNRDYSTHIQEALSRKSNALASLLALGNKYFSETLSRLSGVKPQNAKPVGSAPKIEGSIPGSSPKSSLEVKSFKELDEEILSIAASLQAQNRS